MGNLPKIFTFWKANQAVTLQLRSIVKIKDEPVNADPQLIFHRLITVRERCEDVLSLFRYGLCTYLAALSESSSFPLQPNKAALADYLWKSIIKEEQRIPLHVLPCSVSSTMIIRYAIGTYPISPLLYFASHRCVGEQVLYVTASYSTFLC